MMPTAVPRARASHVLVGLAISRAKPSAVEMAGGGVGKAGRRLSKRVANGTFPSTVQHGNSKILCILYTYMSIYVYTYLYIYT